MIRLVYSNEQPRRAKSLDDLLHLLSVQVRKFESDPTDTLRRSVQRTFDRIVDRLG